MNPQQIADERQKTLDSYLDIGSSHKNIDRSDSLSGSERRKLHQRQTKTVKSHTAVRGNNYGARRAKTSRTGAHIDQPFDLLMKREKIGASSFPHFVKQTSKMKGVVGLQNLGLTCYGNAVLQSLRHIERVPWILQSGKYDTLFVKAPSEKRAKQQEMISSLADAFQQQETSTGGILRPAGLWKVLRSAVQNTVYDQFIQTAPHDAHEFLMLLLETLHESTSTEVEMQIMKSAPVSDKERRIVQALECWKTEFTKQYSPFVDLFHGLLHVQIQCLSCKNISHKWETFNTLKAVVPEKNISTDMNRPDLLSMLQGELMGEDIEGYQCDHCSPTRTTAHRAAYLWRLPQTIIICLKRFKFDGKKIHTQISAPCLFDTQPLFSEESPEKNGITEFKLRAIVDHHGGSGGGHYTAQCCHKENEKWILYDDETTTELDSPKFGDSTYILFYERMPIQRKKSL